MTTKHGYSNTITWSIRSNNGGEVLKRSYNLFALIGLKIVHFESNDSLNRGGWIHWQRKCYSTTSWWGDGSNLTCRRHQGQLGGEIVFPPNPAFRAVGLPSLTAWNSVLRGHAAVIRWWRTARARIYSRNRPWAAHLQGVRIDWPVRRHPVTCCSVSLLWPCFWWSWMGIVENMLKSLWRETEGVPKTLQRVL